MSLVHLSFSLSTVKRPAGAGRSVRRLPCLCRSSPFDLNAPQHTHHSLNISSYEVFGNVITRVTAVAQYACVSQPCCVFSHVMCRRPASWKGSDRCLDHRERTLTLNVWSVASNTLNLPECSCSGFRHRQPGPDVSTSGLDLTCSRKFPIWAKNYSGADGRLFSEIYLLATLRLLSSAGPFFFFLFFVRRLLVGERVKCQTAVRSLEKLKNNDPHPEGVVLSCN